jgi:hypothetical protein
VEPGESCVITALLIRNTSKQLTYYPARNLQASVYHHPNIILEEPYQFTADAHALQENVVTAVPTEIKFRIAKNFQRDDFSKGHKWSIKLKPIIFTSRVSHEFFMNSDHEYIKEIFVRYPLEIASLYCL